MKVSKKKDLILGLFCIVFAAFIFYVSMGMPQTEYEGDPGPRVIPIIGSVIMAIFGIIITVHPEADGPALLTRAQWKDVGKLASVYVLLALLLWLVGFTVAVPIVLFVATFMLSQLSVKNATVKQRLTKSFIFAVVAGTVLYVVYIIALGASLPKGILWDVFK